MDIYEKTYRVIEESLHIGGVPLIRLKPEGLDGDLETIIFYHGLGSKKENQRLRAYNFALVGYQVFIPDALYHGERGSGQPIEDMEEMAQVFWEACLKSVGESKILIDEIIGNYRGNKDRIYLMGHSMGGFTAAGAFTHNSNVRGAIVINGSFNWIGFNNMLRRTFIEFLDYELAQEEEIELLDPMNNLEKLEDRPILLVHGEADRTVNIDIQRQFYSIMKELGHEKIQMKEYDELGHFVTTNMLEDILIYLKGLGR